MYQSLGSNECSSYDRFLIKFTQYNELICIHNPTIVVRESWQLAFNIHIICTFNVVRLVACIASLTEMVPLQNSSNKQTYKDPTLTVPDFTDYLHYKPGERTSTGELTTPIVCPQDILPHISLNYSIFINTAGFKRCSFSSV